MIARTTLLLAACAPAMADITLSRTVNSLAAGSSLNVTVEGSACSTKDAYGSNECDVHWGNTYTVDVAASLAEDLTTGSKIAVDLKLDGLVPFKASCAACGANCSVTVPIIKQSFNFAMPACPISVKAGIAKTISAALPTKSPVPLKSASPSRLPCP